MTNTATPEARRAEILNMLDSKMTVVEIAEKWKLSQARIYQLLGPTQTPRRLSVSILSVYRFIEAYQKEHKFNPSVKDICVAFPDSTGKTRSPSVAKFWLDAMVKLDMIEPRPPYMARVIVLKALNKKNARIREMLENEKEQNDKNS